MENHLVTGAPVFLNDFKAGHSAQDGENGIIQKIFETIGVEGRLAVDIGAFDLQLLSNVYPLWKEQGWRALLVEANPVYYQKMKRQGFPTNVTLLNRRVSAQGPDSLDHVLDEHGVPPEFDLLGIDVDGIDYHIWKHLERHRPRVVVIEYNPTVPSHLSVIGSEQGNYVGASARALADLGEKKGYTVVACTKVSLFFVRSEQSHFFKHAGDLDKLFDTGAVNYAMTAYDGSLFYSNSFLPYGHNPFSKENRKLENATAFLRPPSTLAAYAALKWKAGWVDFRRKVIKPIIMAISAGRNG